MDILWLHEISWGGYIIIYAVFWLRIYDLSLTIRKHNKKKMRNILLTTKKERDYVPKKWQRKPVEMSHIKEGISFLVGCCNKSTTNWVFFLRVLEIKVPVESVSGEKSLPGSLPIVHCVLICTLSIVSNYILKVSAWFSQWHFLHIRKTKLVDIRKTCPVSWLINGGSMI